MIDNHLYIEGYLHHPLKVYTDSYTNQHYQQLLFQDFIQALNINNVQAVLLSLQTESMSYQNIEYICNFQRLNYHNDLDFYAEFMISCNRLSNLNLLYEQHTFKHFTLRHFYIKQNNNMPLNYIYTTENSTKTKKYNIEHIGERKIAQL